MSTLEIDTFVKKFYQLWNAGHTAHLNVDTHAGKAWVGLRVQLGHAPGPLHHHPHPPFFQAQKKTDSPSRQRRRARRAAARLVNAEEAIIMKASEETAIEETADNVIIEDENVEETNNSKSCEDIVKTVNEEPNTADDVIEEVSVAESESERFTSDW